MSHRCDGLHGAAQFVNSRAYLTAAASVLVTQAGLQVITFIVYSYYFIYNMSKQISSTNSTRGSGIFYVPSAYTMSTASLHHSSNSALRIPFFLSKCSPYPKPGQKVTTTFEKFGRRSGCCVPRWFWPGIRSHCKGVGHHPKGFDRHGLRVSSTNAAFFLPSFLPFHYLRARGEAFPHISVYFVHPMSL